MVDTITTRDYTVQNLMHTLATTTPFVGRSQELTEIADLLADPGCRALTLVGPGGIGKTRLALETAARHQDKFQDGVFFIPLQALETPDLILPHIVGELDISVNRGMDVLTQLLEYLDQQHVLFVLDNFEHLLENYIQNAKTFYRMKIECVVFLIKNVH